MASKSEAPKSTLLHLLPLRKRQGLQNSEENFIFLFSQGRAHVNTFKKDWNLSANQERAFQTLSSNIYSRDGNNLEILPFSYPCFFYAGVIQKLLKSKNPCGFVIPTLVLQPFIRTKIVKKAYLGKRGISFSPSSDGI